MTEPAAPAPRPGLRERRRRELVDRVTQVGFDLFLERGLAAVSVAEICRGAELSQSTFFRHFRTKEAVVDEIVRFSIDSTARRLAEMPDEPGVAAPYVRALRSEWDALARPEDLDRLVATMTDASSRRAFASDAADGTADEMTLEIARRLGLDRGDDAVHMIRGILWLAVDHAMTARRAGESIDQLFAAVTTNLRVLAPFERDHAGR